MRWSTATNDWKDGHMTESAQVQSPLALVLLGLLAEEPMHAYRMRLLIRQRGKDTVVNVARSNSVYQTIDRLRRSGLIQVRATTRGAGRPDRTIYEITAEGKSTLRRWLATTLSTPAREFPEFPAALATMSATTPGEVTRALTARAAALTQRINELSGNTGDLPRLFLIEDEYAVAMARAELRWVRALIADLERKELFWNRKWIDEIRSRFGAR
jgi:DNA-binding PadR family transcriptional regulator